MTTTLRPAAPRQDGPDGTRSRDFAVCVNGRPVGQLRLSTDPRYGPRTGRIAGLHIDAPDRRRGRGAVAVLAAEEVLRGWGCRQVRSLVPADEPFALRLALGMGYTERNRGMAKPLTEPVPDPPPGSVVRAMDERDYARWFERTRADYVRRWQDEGVAHDRALALADADYAATLPDGHRSAGAALRVLVHEGAEVGWLWVRVQPEAGRRLPAWVYLVETAEEHRGRGHGRTLMLAAERECLAVGSRELGLNVFADNVPAQRLYASLGYRPTSYEMVKSLA